MTGVIGKIVYFVMRAWMYMLALVLWYPLWYWVCIIEKCGQDVVDIESCGDSHGSYVCSIPADLDFLVSKLLL